MNKMFLIVIICSASIITCQTYDYLLFVQEIAGTVCQKYDCTSEYSLALPQTALNMHGMWPNYNNGSYPTYCGSLSSDQYNDDKIASYVVNMLNANWVGLYSSTSEFRNREWQKHGSCFIEQMPERQSKNLRKPNSIDAAMNEFFGDVMTVKSNINLESVLYNSSLNDAENGALWNYTELQNSLSSALRGITDFNFNCDQNNNLYTINICLNATNLDPINCPNTQGFKYNCSKDYSITVPYFQLN